MVGLWVGLAAGRAAARDRWSGPACVGLGRVALAAALPKWPRFGVGHRRAVGLCRFFSPLTSDDTLSTWCVAAAAASRRPEEGYIERKASAAADAAAARAAATTTGASGALTTGIASVHTGAARAPGGGVPCTCTACSEPRPPTPCRKSGFALHQGSSDMNALHTRQQ